MKSTSKIININAGEVVCSAANISKIPIGKSSAMLHCSGCTATCTVVFMEIRMRLVVGDCEDYVVQNSRTAALNNSE